MSHKVITIAQQKGGAGKTTLAAHLAVEWSQWGYRVAIVDTDPQGSLTAWYNIRVKQHDDRVTPLSFSAISGWRIGSEIARLRKQHDIIVIDSPPHTETEARTAIRNSDLLVVPVQPSPVDLWATKGTLDIAGAEKIKVQVVMNRVPANSKLAERVKGGLPGLTRACIGNRVVFASSLMDGLTAGEAAPHSLAAIEIEALADEILGLFEQEGLKPSGVSKAAIDA